MPDEASSPHGSHEPLDSVGARVDAVANRERIVEAATALAGNRHASMAEIAAAAGVGRSTLYRHFPTRSALAVAIANGRAERPGLAEAVGAADPTEPSMRVASLPHRQPGQLGRTEGLALEVTHVLDEVPPHLIADQLVAEARRAAGAAVALYVADIDGSQLLRLAGTEEFPETLADPPALGPEIVPEGLPAYGETLLERFPRSGLYPLWVRGRVIGLLLCMGEPLAALEDIAKQGAAALELAGDYTDMIETARRRKPTSPAAEVQQHLLPPRIVRLTGAQVAGALLPSYEVAGDWFDYVENRDGAWIAIADAPGTGSNAAGLSATALGALRSARRSGLDLSGAAKLMDEAVRGLGHADFTISALLLHWHAPTSTLTWVNCGHAPAQRIGVEGEMRELEGPILPRLGARDHAPTGVEVTRVALEPGERIVLLTDGILSRTQDDGSDFGVDGVRAAVAEATAPTAPATALAIQRAVVRDWAHPLEDDATIVVLALD